MPDQSEHVPCADGHPMAFVTIDGEGGIHCSACGSSGREVDTTSHPNGEHCRRTGCHEGITVIPGEVDNKFRQTADEASLSARNEGGK